MEKKINKLWFVNQLKDQGKTNLQLAKFIHVDPSAVTRIFNGERRMSMAEAAKIAKFLGHSVITVIEHAGIPLSQISPKETGMVRVFGTADAGGKVDMTPPKEAPYVTAPNDLPDHGIALRLLTEGTAQEFANGWVVFYEPLPNIPIDAIGRLCVVKLAGENWFRLCVVKRSIERGKYRLSTLWGESVDNAAELESASPVIWIKTSI